MKNKVIRESLFRPANDLNNIGKLNHFQHLREVRRMSASQQKVRWRPMRTYDGRYEYIEDDRLFKINPTFGSK